MTHANHDDYDGMAVGWALHALEPGEEQAFAEHLATCDRCQRMVAESEEALGELAYDVPLVEPPPRVLERIRQETGAVHARPPGRLAGRPSAAVVTPLVRRMPPRSVRRVLPAIAAGLVLVALLGWNVVLQSRVDEAQRVAAERQQVISELARSTTRAVLTDSADRTVAYVVQRGSQLEVVAGGLTPNDRRRSTYVLWAVQGSGQPPRAVGTFDVVSTTMDIRPVDGTPPPADSFSGFAVSREPGRSAPERPSQVVATGAVQS